MATKWLTLAELPYETNNIISLNSDEILIRKTKLRSQRIVLAKYCPHSDTYKRIMHIKTEMEHRSAILSFDEAENKLWLFSRNKIGFVDMSTQLHISYETILVRGGYLFVEGQFHIFRKSKHGIFTLKEGALKEIKLINHTMSFGDFSHSIQRRTVYVSSKECILHFENNWKMLWMFSLSENEWTHIKVQMPKVYAAVLSSNQRYVVLFGNEQIFVLDMRIENEWKMKKCSIKCPKLGYDDKFFHVVKTGGVDSKDGILVFGFIRELFQTKEFESIGLPPTHIMMLIAQNYSMETFHWFEDSDHYGIYLKDILSNLTHFVEEPTLMEEELFEWFDSSYACDREVLQKHNCILQKEND